MLVGFEQDTHPDAPPGAGYFMSDAGERAYAYDPNLAQSLSGQPPPVSPMQEPEQPSYDLMQAAEEEPDQRLAMGGGGNRSAPVGDPGGQMSSQAPSASDVGPNMSAAPPQPPAAPNVSQAGPMSTSTGGGPVPQAQPAPAEVDPDEQARAQQQAYVNQKVYHAPVAGGLRPKSAEVTSEGAEAPMQPEDWKELQDANEAIIQSKVAQAGVQRAQAEHQIAQAQAQMPILQKQYEENKAQYDQARASAKQDLAKVQGLLQEVNTKRVDHNRFFNKVGTVGIIAAGIAQALGASAAILSGTGKNLVAEQMNRIIDEDVAEQKDDIENGRANANNAMKLLQDRYNFDIPQAESALKIAQMGVVNAQLKQYEGMKLSQDAQMGLEQWHAENQKAMFLEARKLYTQSMGKQTRKESLTYQKGTAGGYLAPTHKERMQKLEEIKASQDTGTIPKPEEGKIAPATVIYGVDGKPVQATSEKSADEIRKQRKLWLQAKPSLNSLQELAGIGKSFSWDDSAAYAVHLENVINTANTIAGQGVVRGDDIDRYKKAIAQGGLGAKRALAELSKIVDNAYQSSVDAEAAPSVSVDYSRGKPRAKYTKQRAPTPSVGRASSSKPDVDDLHKALAEYGQ